MNTQLGLLTAMLLVATATACNGDDDAETTLPTDPPGTVPASTVPASSATDPPTTPPTTAAATTVAPSTTVNIEALKAEIAADYVESFKARRQLTLEPSLEDIEARAATVSASGSPDYEGLLALVRNLVDSGERVIPGDPPIDETNVESVEVSDPAAVVATVTSCLVFNWQIVGADGIPIGETGVLRAGRVRQDVQRTNSGWLPASETSVLSAETGATTCSDQ